MLFLVVLLESEAANPFVATFIQILDDKGPTVCWCQEAPLFVFWKKKPYERSNNECQEMKKKKGKTNPELPKTRNWYDYVHCFEKCVRQVVGLVHIVNNRFRCCSDKWRKKKTLKRRSLCFEEEEVLFWNLISVCRFISSADEDEKLVFLRVLEHRKLLQMRTRKLK